MNQDSLLKRAAMICVIVASVVYVFNTLASIGPTYAESCNAYIAERQLVDQLAKVTQGAYVAKVDMDTRNILEERVKAAEAAVIARGNEMEKLRTK